MHDNPEPIVCQACGNDDASWHLCSDCLAPDPIAIADLIADRLGGRPFDYLEVAEAIAGRFGTG